MPQEPTIPLEAEAHGLPVRTVRVDVVEGPDQGLWRVAASEVLSIGTAEGNDLVLSDPTVSRYHLDLLRRGDGVVVVDHESTNGTIAGVAKIERGMVPPGTVLRLGRTRVRVQDGESVTAELHPEASFGGLRGRSPAMRRLMAQVARAAPTDVPVLLIGESGTGKELVARALHDRGARRGRPFEVVDCASLTPTLVASELFGHERGAFTGADRQHVGAFERAHGGTLFLDEVGELAPELQPTLLGALERRCFRRVGGREEIGVDVRVISATNRDLRSAINSNGFRLDLYYRLAVLTLRIPPLREHVDDVPLLVEHFLEQQGHAGRLGELFPQAALDALRSHGWPGNVRELRNLVEATVAIGELPEMLDVHRPAEGLDPSYIPMARIFPLPFKEARAAALREFEARYLRVRLERANDNVSKAARDAGIDRSYLFELLKRHRLR